MKRDPFPINEMDHKFGKIAISLTIQNFRSPKMLFDGLGVTFDIPQIVSPGT